MQLVTTGGWTQNMLLSEAADHVTHEVDVHVLHGQRT